MVAPWDTGAGRLTGAGAAIDLGRCLRTRFVGDVDGSWPTAASAPRLTDPAGSSSLDALFNIALGGLAPFLLPARFRPVPSPADTDGLCDLELERESEGSISAVDVDFGCMVLLADCLDAGASCVCVL